MSDNQAEWDELNDRFQELYMQGKDHSVAMEQWRKDLSHLMAKTPPGAIDPRFRSSAPQHVEKARTTGSYLMEAMGVVGALLGGAYIGGIDGRKR